MANQHFSLLLPFFLLLLLSFTTLSHCRPPFACSGGPTRYLPFCQISKPIQVRVRDLIGRLTTEEKIRLLVNNAAGVPRLGISGYEWWSEALHGVSNVGPGSKFGGDFPAATSFPQVITTAASFNDTLWEEIGKVVSDEARAMYNGGQAGLTFWSPNINIFRDPRWGRGQETPGEDPLVSGRYAAAYVRGLQQPYGGNKLKLAACCKHFTAYDLDNWGGTDRYHFNAKVSVQDLKDTYDVPFQMCVKEGKAAAVMCSYNEVNGVPTCADRDLLFGTVRQQWNLAGYIVSDCDSVDVFYNSQHYTSSPAAAVAAALKAGLDLDCGPFLAVFTGEALKENLVSEVDIDNAVMNTITVQMRLGMFDGEPATQPFGHLGPADVCTPAHQELALEAARQGIVLLKNDGHALPFDRSHLHSVAVVGPNAAATVTMIGNYAGIGCRYTSPVGGIQRFVQVVHQVGCTNVACAGNQPIGMAVNAARTTDATILVVGLDQSIEAEARDRRTLLLPGRQQELVTEVAMASKGPTILVVMCGGPVDVTFAEKNPKISAILWVGYPGQAGGAAIAEAIFGLFSPGGKLPMTWYPEDYVRKVPMTDMALRADPSKGYPGRTYRFYHGPVVYPFGHGLSYTSFKHSIAYAPSSLSLPITGQHSFSVDNNSSVLSDRAVRVTHLRCEDLIMDLHLDLKNTGEFDGKHTVFVFSSFKDGRWGFGRQLVAYNKVHLMAKAQTRVEFSINVCKDLSFVDTNGIQRIPIGEHNLHVGELTHSFSVRADTTHL